MIDYNHKNIESKWREVWGKTGIYNTDLDSKKPKHYNLVMFPYPSGSYLHIGHVYSYTGADVYGRFKRLNGFNVFEPIGYDAFGLPAENYAIKQKIHPQKSTKENIVHAEKQLKNFGCMFDWEKTVTTSDPSYYKWTQWLFLKLFERELAYQKEAPVNWCPGCKTVLANEQVIDGACERCDNIVEQKYMKQWFFRITKYVDVLDKDLDKVDWPKSSVLKQRNWIGRSEGTVVKFPISNFQFPMKPKKSGSGHSYTESSGTGKQARMVAEEIEVFTTRVDTIFGCTFIILAPENPLVDRITTNKYREEVEKYKLATKKKTELERLENMKNKTGVFTGAYCINPATGENVPIWIADFVIASYGGGAVFADAHDERDFEFAKKFGIALKTTIKPADGRDDSKIKNLEECFTGDGILYDSGEFSGLTSKEARVKITAWLEKKGFGSKKVNYRLHDWLISRQRYWGTPIPIIYCEKCASTGSAKAGIIPVPEKDLPIELPEVKDFQPKGTGKSPLYDVKEFVNVTCPKCGGKAERETDTMDTFVDSSFYFLRYPSVGNDEKFIDDKITKSWLPVDMYVGGAEHVTMHLLYARFITKALHDAGIINFDEPFLKLRHQGMILGPDGKKMSKSKGNVVIPDETIKKHGADIFRTYLLFMGPFEDGGPWNLDGMKGIKRFLDKVWSLGQEIIENTKAEKAEKLLDSEKSIEETAVARTIHKTIKKVTEDINNFKFNTAVSAMMECMNELIRIKEKLLIENSPNVWRNAIENLAVILSPFAPHMAEEIWEGLGFKESIVTADWPSYDKNLIQEDTVVIPVQINGKVRDQILIDIDSSEEDVKRQVYESAKVQKYIGGKEIIKTVFVPGKLISIVIKG